MRGRLFAILLGVTVGLLLYAGFSGGWQFVERFSWVVIILGLPLAVYQLWLLQSDQNRIAMALSRQPRLRTGFGLTKDKKGVISEMRIAPTWSPDAQASAPVRIEFTTRNFGTRTARNVLLNIVIPEVLAAVVPTAQRGGDVENRPYLFRPPFDLNPDDTHAWQTDMPIPKGVSVLEIIVLTSMLDIGEATETLRIHVQGP